MKFEPKTAKEISEAGLFQPGEYDFEITDAYEAISQSSGKDMITLRLRVFNEGGDFTPVTDYLLESVAYKLRHACEATGLLDDYETGSLDADGFKGKTGRLKLRIDKDKTGRYADKNGVADYIARDSASFAPRAASPPKQFAHAHSGARPDLDDEIPF